MLISPASVSTCLLSSWTSQTWLPLLHLSPPRCRRYVGINGCKSSSRLSTSSCFLIITSHQTPSFIIHLSSFASSPPTGRCNSCLLLIFLLILLRFPSASSHLNPTRTQKKKKLPPSTVPVPSGTVVFIFPLKSAFSMCSKSLYKLQLVWVLLILFLTLLNMLPSLGQL